jgi:hypothetical protein
MNEAAAPAFSEQLYLGTFARVWLARLHGEDENKVFALKILRKVDGKNAAIPSSSH